MAEPTPDLREMALGLARAVNRHHPGTILPQEMERVKGANNMMLVMLRILTALAKRHGVTKEEVQRVVDGAKRGTVRGDMFDAAPLESGRVTGVHTDWDVITGVDEALLKHRADLPGWFIDEFWPPCLQRCAAGEGLTDRERDIAMYWTSVARGER